MEATSIIGSPSYQEQENKQKRETRNLLAYFGINKPKTIYVSVEQLRIMKLDEIAAVLDGRASLVGVK